jgi:hypothetical protein
VPVARGLSNREIAAALTTTERTSGAMWDTPLPGPASAPRAPRPARGVGRGPGPRPTAGVSRSTRQRGSRQVAPSRLLSRRFSRLFDVGSRAPDAPNRHLSA